jgi:Holliday junction resolvasome RuvABC ATP-dependent DNA helicase subunit
VWKGVLFYEMGYKTFNKETSRQMQIQRFAGVFNMIALLDYLTALDESLTQKTEEIGEILTSPMFEDVIYPENQKEFMRLIVSDLKQGKHLNLLFSGLAGTGKTYSAKMLAAETSKPFVYLTGSQGKQKIVETLMNIKKNSIVLIDEIHNLPERVAEIIYPAIEYDEIYLNGKKKQMDCVFIGTTTEPEKLPKPLLDRFMRIEFEEPDKDALELILQKMNVPERVILKLLCFTQNIRSIKKILTYIKLFGEINEDSLDKVFAVMKIDKYTYLSADQQKYIDYLNQVDKASLRNLSLILRRSGNYLLYEVEPELIKKGMIFITSKGRELNPEFKEMGYAELQKERDKHHAKYSKEDKDMAICWLKEHNIGEKLGSRYFELVNSVAEDIANGIVPDSVDYDSFSDDKSIEESKKDNRDCLDEL